ncbi:hypothetical protein [Helicobacter sp.]|uniref:hypothetical protein n=1 Tax=Helicobacter sp. TaxID=218 RepID=UPI00388D5579
MEVNWKKIGLTAAGLGGLGYLAYKYYNAKEEEKEDYAFKRAQRAKKRAREETKQELLQERLIEEIEAPFARYCADMRGFSFGAGFLELRDKLERASQESGNTDSSDGETLSELAQDSRICDEKSGLSSDWQGSYLSGNDRRQSRRIHDLSRKAESTRNAKLFQKMQEINAYITSFSPTHDELLKVLSLGQEMFDHISRAKPFAQFMQASKCDESSEQSASEQNTPSDRAKQLTSLYAAVITSLSGDEEESLWDTPTCISRWRHQWLFNTGLTLPLQVCMMKHLQSVFGIEPANFSTALSKLAKDAAHKYRIIGLDDKEAQPSPASFFGFFNVPTHQSPESPLSGVYGHILRDIGERYSELLAECEGDREKLESSIEAL